MIEVNPPVPLVLMCLIACIASTFADAQEVESTSALRDRFLQAVQRTEEKVKQLRFHVKCVGNSEETEPSAGKEGKRALSREFELAVDGERALSKSAHIRQNGNTIEATNGEYMFQITTTDELRPYTITYVEQSVNDTSVAEYSTRQKEALIALPLAAFYFLRTQLSQLVQSPSFTIKQISIVSSPSGELARIEFEHLTTDMARIEAGERISDGFLLCDPAHDWALREYGGTVHRQIVGGPTAQSHSEIEFGDVVGEFPLASKVTTLIQRSNGTTSRTTCTVESIEDKIPKDLFYLSHYGFSEPVFDSGQSWKFLLVSALVSAFLMAAGAFLVIYRSYKPKKTAV